MNILFISHGLYPCKIGGAEVFNYYLLKELCKRHNIFILTHCQKKIDIDASFIRVKPEKFGIRRLSIPLFDLINLVRLKVRIDFLHIASYMRAHWLQWLPYPLIKKIYGIPYVVTIHGGGMHEWKPVFPHKLLFDNASVIIGVSERIKQEYERRINREVKYIPPLIPFIKSMESKDRLRQRYGLESDDTVLLSVGSIKRIKGCDILLKAFIDMGRVFIQENRLKLLFVGDGEMKTELESKAREAHLSNRIHFTGSIPHEEISSVYKMSDIYIIPSLFEGTPISMLEAMFNRLPIIGSDANGINNIIKHGKNGLLFKMNDVVDLKNKIIYVIRDKELSERIAHKAEEDYKKNYQFEKVVNQYLEVYEHFR